MRELEVRNILRSSSRTASFRGGTRDQSDDCIIETDPTMSIPNSYVSETPERLTLYRKLDDIKDERSYRSSRRRSRIALGRYRSRSLNSRKPVRLRWLGQQMGPVKRC
ncbi:MAG: hypothetical protein IPP33_12195 [Flavobacteriales bacterium]|nr:hypothetical protein [Flavobacteriales bacterium]